MIKNENQSIIIRIDSMVSLETSLSVIFKEKMDSRVEAPKIHE